MDGYYYLHSESKDLIYKHANYEISNLRDSDFVQMFWTIDTKSRLNAWCILIEALALGANKLRVESLADKWQCHDNDAIIFCQHAGINLSKHYNEDQKLFHYEASTLNNKYKGYGFNALGALSALCRNLDFIVSKLGWHDTFLDLCKKELL